MWRRAQSGDAEFFFTSASFIFFFCGHVGAERNEQQHAERSLDAPL